MRALKDVIDATTNKANTRLMLFRWLVFNIAVANDDCHLKNLSFFISSEGVQLAPHYDLLATSAYYTKAFAVEKATWPNVRMAIPLGKALKEVSTRLPEALRKEMDEIRQLHARAPEAAKVQLAAEDRLLRVFEHIILKEMLERLR